MQKLLGSLKEMNKGLCDRLDAVLEELKAIRQVLEQNRGGCNCSEIPAGPIGHRLYDRCDCE